jgi:two-component system response regulator HydG
MNNNSLGRILIADDEPLFLRTTSQLLTKAGYDCVGVPDGTAALALLHDEPFDLILSDLNLPGNIKLELLRQSREKWAGIPLIVLTGAPTLPSAIESVRLGIADYLLKPVKYEVLLSSIRRALAHARREPASSAQSDSEVGFSNLLGESNVMRELKSVIDRVAGTDANVLITGESGTGKEVVAQAIHQRSRRAKASFQVIDCTAIPESLFESALFGHAKGAFTSAVQDQPGLLIQADRGTAFFDEIGELPMPQQAKLLRVIQEQTFVPVGKTATVEIDTRFISATNRNLELEVHAGRFRRDLFYRLAVIPIEMPPLRARGDDVILLARHFVRQLGGAERPGMEFSDSALELLRGYPWPGNIRELRNAVEHALAVSKTDVIVPTDLPPTLQRSLGQVPGQVENAPSKSRTEALNDAERDYLVSLLEQNQGNVSRAAIQANMSRQGLHKLLKKHGISRHAE